jgi:hypothetical protein
MSTVLPPILAGPIFLHSSFSNSLSICSELCENPVIIRPNKNILIHAKNLKLGLLIDASLKNQHTYTIYTLHKQLFPHFLPKKREKESGQLIKKTVSKDERAWFLSRMERRAKTVSERIFLAGENSRVFVSTDLILA